MHSTFTFGNMQCLDSNWLLCRNEITCVLSSFALGVWCMLKPFNYCNFSRHNYIKTIQAATSAWKLKPIHFLVVLIILRVEYNVCYCSIIAIYITEICSCNVSISFVYTFNCDLENSGKITPKTHPMPCYYLHIVFTNFKLFITEVSYEITLRS